MTKDKERDDALIAEAERLADRDWSGDQTYAQFFAPILLELQRSGWKPKPDRAEVLAKEYYSNTELARAGRFSAGELAIYIRRHFDELRAEWEAERPAVVVPREAKLWADSVGYATRYEERTTAKWIKSLDGAKGGE